MPSTPLHSSFASAAAGISNDNTTGRGQSSRPEFGSLGDWSRRPNGATQTFRRSSAANTTSSQSQQSREPPPTTTANLNPSTISSVTTSNTTYVPPRQNISSMRNGLPIDTRYSKPQLLQLYKEQREAGNLENGLSQLYLGDWEGGAASNGGVPVQWGRSDENKREVVGGLDACWDRAGTIEPLGLLDMTSEEKELFTTSVNSPLKGPNQNTNRDNNQREGGGPTRKTSFSQNHSSTSNFGLTSPTTSRPSNRRRETGESSPWPRDSLASPTTRGARNEAGGSGFTLQRRKTDKDTDIPSSAIESDRPNPIGSLRRTSHNPLSAGLVEPQSPWSTGPQGVGNSPMGAFGSLGVGGGGGGGAVAVSGPNSEKRPGLARGESRFRNLMGKQSIDEESNRLQEKVSLKSLDRVEESEQSRQQTPNITESVPERPVSQGTDPYATDSVPYGSAALGGLNEDSPGTQQRSGRHGTPSRSRLEEEAPTSDLFSHPGAYGIRPGDQYQHQNFPGAYSHIGEPNEPASPTFTNPYQSPPQQMNTLRDLDHDELDGGNFHLPGLGAGPPGEMGPDFGMPFGGAFDRNRLQGSDMRGFDRISSASQRAGRSFPGLPGVVGLPGLGSPSTWASTLPIGTPTREKAGFMDTFGERQGDSSFPGGLSSGPGNAGSMGRGGKLGSLFPNAMQEQMRNSVEQDREVQEHHRDNSSPFRTGRGKFDDFFGGSEKSTNLRESEPGFISNEQSIVSPYDSPSQVHASSQTSVQAGIQSGGQRMASVSVSTPSQPPAAQQKTMVMPDRIRWLYRDPQGNPQGPWSGLEMHDWYRAGFFSPELLVKKQEDPDFEPLAQLIRKIGNSREPFLVPQIGIPGPPTAVPGAPWPSQGPQPAPANTAAAAQPPFAGSFPSFGTTLTADQQNALERRKQEEQFLMARQKEHLAHQQVLAKQLHMQGHSVLPQQLHHNSSAHSLQSQASFGSMNSPSVVQPSPAQNYPNLPLQSQFNDSFRLGGGVGIGPIGAGVETLGHIREEDAERSHMLQHEQQDQQHQSRFGGRMDPMQGAIGRGSIYHESLQPAQQLPTEEQRIATMLEDRARLQTEQEQDEARKAQQQDIETSMENERLQQFHELQNEKTKDASAGDQSHETWQSEEQGTKLGQTVSNESVKENQKLSLTEQVQKAASAKQTRTTTQSPWAKVDQSNLEKSPPRQTASPLPAPAARRNRQHVADALNAESVSQSQSPSVESATGPSVAPWANQSLEVPKASSLKEIQDLETRRAAKQEEIAAAARRANYEKELASQMAASSAAPVPGLPSSSTWGSGESPITPVSASSAWASKTGTGNKSATAATAAIPTSTLKKTFSQIQMEEEAALARRRKAAAVAAQGNTASSATTAVAQSGAKRYSDLAGKAASPAIGGPASSGSSAWTTVGASGKAKLPPINTAPGGGVRTVSSNGTLATLSSPVTRPKPTTVKSSLATVQLNAHEEFKKWAIAELRPDLSKGIQVEDFVQGLLNFPPDSDVITEAVHSVSQTLDSRHFAEEFIRRRALADKGKTEPASSGSIAGLGGVGGEGKSGTSSGWNEVARKGSGSVQAPKDDTSSFKIVAAKKKSSKR